MIWTVLVVLGYLIAGLFIGGAGGALISLAMMYGFKWGSTDPTAASVGILGLITVPLGCLIGGVVGVWLALT